MPPKKIPLPNVDWKAWYAGLQQAKSRPDTAAALREIAAFPPAHPDTMERLAFIARKLPVRDWPDRDIRLATIEAESGSAANSIA